MYKCASVTPLLKKQELNADLLRNYRPVSNLHTMSKIVEQSNVIRSFTAMFVFLKTFFYLLLGFFACMFHKVV